MADQTPKTPTTPTPAPPPPTNPTPTPSDVPTPPARPVGAMTTDDAGNINDKEPA